MAERMIEVGGVNYRWCGFLDGGLKIHVEDSDGVGRVLIRDTLDGPWRLWVESDEERERRQGKRA